jgi:DNA-binding HxlR family transcriptional regulator
MRPGYRQFCAISRALDVLGQRWTLLVVRELALRGPLTAAAIARGLPDVPMNQLSERLTALDAHGLISVSRGAGNTRVFSLSDEGRSLEPVLGALASFGLEQLAEAPRRDEVVLPHVLMAQLERRFDAARAAAEGFAGRFELELVDPESLWSVEPGAPAPGRYALIAGTEGLRARAGACLDADASLTLTVDTCTRLITGDPKAPLEIEVEGDSVLADRLLALLGIPAATRLAAAAA